MPSSQESRVRRYIRQHEDKQAKRGRRRFLVAPVRLLFALLFTAVGVYFGIQIYHAIVQPLKTVTALATTVNEEISAVGYFVRAETQIAQEYEGLLQYVPDEGEKVAKTQLYANVYQDPYAAEVTAEIDALSARIATLETALAYSTQSVAASDEDGGGRVTSESASTENLSDAIRAGMMQINTIADTRGYAQMADEISALEHNIINRDFAFSSYEEVQANISQLKSTRTRLQNSIGERQRGLYTPRAGYFSAYADGYEQLLTFASLKNMTLDTYLGLDDYEPEVLPDVVGKIVTDFSWYFVTSLNPEDAGRLTVGQYVYLQFDATGDLQVRCRVYDIRRQGDADALVIFSSDRELESLISLRKQSARIIVDTYEGLKVPKTALRVDGEYNMGVYVITGMYAEFKKIYPVYETEDYYIVSTDPSKTSSLLVYDEIIVNGRNLENKKVIA